LSICIVDIWKSCTHSATANIIIQKIKSIFARWGIPLHLLSDNGPPFSSQEFAKFIGDCGIEHITSSLCYPQSNGAAEHAVQTTKKILSQDDSAMALITYRCSKTVTGYSPNEVMLGTDVRTNLPKRAPATIVNHDKLLESDLHAKLAAQTHYNQTALQEPLSQLTPTIPVRVRKDNYWSEQTYKVVGNANAPRSYIVLNEKTGRTFRCNRCQLLPAIKEAVNISDNMDNNPINIDRRTTSSGRVVKVPERYSP